MVWKHELTDGFFEFSQLSRVFLLLVNVNLVAFYQATWLKCRQTQTSDRQTYELGPSVLQAATVLVFMASEKIIW